MTSSRTSPYGATCVQNNRSASRSRRCELLDARALLADPQARDTQRAAVRDRLADYAETRAAKLRRSAAAGDELVAELRSQLG